MKQHDAPPGMTTPITRLWRLAAAAVFTAGTAVAAPASVTAPVLQTDTVPLTDMSAAGRSRFYDAFNRLIRNDAGNANLIVAMDPTPHGTVPSFTAAAAAMLKEHNLLRKQPIEPFAPTAASLKDLIDLRIHGIGAPQSNLMDFQVSQASYIWPLRHGASSAAYVCLAVGPRAHAPIGTVMQQDTPQQTPAEERVVPLSPAFRQKLQDASGYYTVIHEAGHCMRGFEGLPFARLGLRRLSEAQHSEASADAFSILFRIQQGEPDIRDKIVTQLMWRRSGQIAAPANYDSSYDIAPVIPLLLQDMRHKDLRQELAGLPPSRLSALAIAYTDRATAHQHRAFGIADTDQAAQMRAVRESTIGFVRDAILPPAHGQPPEADKLTLPQALRIVQLADATVRTLDLTPAMRAGLENRMNGLRRRFPAIMRKAEAQFTEELLHYSTPAGAAQRVAPRGALIAPGR